MEIVLSSCNYDSTDIVGELMAPTYLFLLEAKGTAKSVRVFPIIPAIETIIAHIPKAFRLKLCSSM